MKNQFLMAAALIAGLLLTGCQTASYHTADVRAARDADDRLTVGTVQREIREGMSSADVVSVLGSPNMVTTDDQRRETWVYDKIATETVYSHSSGGVNAMVLGAGVAGTTLLGGGGGGNVGRGAGAQSTSQRTLTIIVKFDHESRVRDFAYRSSSF